MSSIKKPTSSFVQLAMLLVGSTLFCAEGAHALDWDDSKGNYSQSNSFKPSFKNSEEFLGKYNQNVRKQTDREIELHRERVGAFERNKETPDPLFEGNSEFFSQNSGTGFDLQETNNKNLNKKFTDPQNSKESLDEILEKFSMQLQDAAKNITSLKKEKKSMNKNIRILTEENESMKNFIAVLESNLTQKDNQIEYLKSNPLRSEGMIKVMESSELLKNASKSEKSDEDNSINQNDEKNDSSHEDGEEETKSRH